MKVFKMLNSVKVVLFFVVIIFPVWLCLDASADDYTGNYADGVTVTGCDDPRFKQAFTGLCGSVGGASWHIYKTHPSAGDARPRRYFDNGGSPGGDILVGSVTYADAEADCSAKGGGEWYVAYGWDGMYDNPNNKTYVHWGPAKWNEGVIASAGYNTSGQMEYDDVHAHIENGTFVAGWKISEDAAKKLHKEYMGTDTIPSDTGYFCSNLQSSRKLSAKAVGYRVKSDSNGEWFWMNSGNVFDSSTVKKGAPGVVSSTKYSPSEYDFLGWRTTANNWSSVMNRASNISDGDNTLKIDQCVNGSSTVCNRLTYGYNAMGGDKEVYAIYNIRTKFRGKSEVYQTNQTSRSASTGWKASGTANSNLASLKLDGCDNGCNVTFKQNLEKINTTGSYKGSGYFRYNIYKFNSDSTEINKISSSGDASFSEKSYTTTIKTGDSVCQKLEFVNVIDGRGVSLSTAGTMACVSAVINRNDPEGGSVGTGIDITVKKSTSSRWSNGPIYARPTELIEMKGAYTPTAQKYASAQPDYVKLNGGAERKNNSGALSNAVSGWKNAFSIKLTNNAASYAERNKIGTIGLDSLYNLTLNGANSYRIGESDPGRVIVATALTNSNNSTKTTPAAVSITSREQADDQVENNKKIVTVADVDTSSISDDARIIVPYNFGFGKDDTELKLDEIVYAGETTTPEVIFKVGKRYNSVVGATYSTKANVRLQGIVYVMPGNTEPAGTNAYGNGVDSNLCNYFGASECYQAYGVSSNKVYASDSVNKELMKFNVKDWEAGTRICFAAAIYPSNSGAEDNLDIKGSDKWMISNSKCATVAKKPSFQVWGSGISSIGNINTAVAAKNNVVGFSEYNPKGNTNNRYFGSFTELDIVATGGVMGLASGASTGYYGTIVPDPFANNVNGMQPGGNIGNYCLRSPLSFANSTCSNVPGVVGLIGSKIRVKTKTETVKSKLNQLSSNTFSRVAEISSMSAMPNQVTTGTIVLKQENSDVTIDHDITFESGKMYTNLAEVPKVIIYAKNINIACDVKRVDAVLIAEENVNTCSDGTVEVRDVNMANGSTTKKSVSDSGKNSQQLVINGSVITGKMILNRTYGAATGSNSIVPAEIINYDTSLFLWGASKADVTGSGELTTTYQHEIAPRY